MVELLDAQSIRYLKLSSEFQRRDIRRSFKGIVDRRLLEKDDQRVAYLGGG